MKSATGYCFIELRKSVEHQFLINYILSFILFIYTVHFIHFLCNAPLDHRFMELAHFMNYYMDCYETILHWFISILTQMVGLAARTWAKSHIDKIYYSFIGTGNYFQLMTTDHYRILR